MTPEKLMELAKAAMTHAYAPYSHFWVGAAVLCLVLFGSGSFLIPTMLLIAFLLMLIKEDTAHA